MRALIVFSISALLLISCGQKSDQESAKADDILLMTTSGKLIVRFQKELKSELVAAMNLGGPVNAISVCQVRAPEIAAGFSNEFWSIRRVTDKNRNPDNLATEHELEILGSFADTAATGPAHYYEWVDSADTRTFCFYMPIRVMPLCINCHGAEADIDDATRATLSELYPDDKAVGYKAGDLRGMFVVEVIWPDARPFAEALAADSL